MKETYLLVFQIDNLFTKPLMRVICTIKKDKLEEFIYKIEAKDNCILIGIYKF